MDDLRNKITVMFALLIIIAGAVGGFGLAGIEQAVSTQHQITAACTTAKAGSGPRGG